MNSQDGGFSLFSCVVTELCGDGSLPYTTIETSIHTLGHSSPRRRGPLFATQGFGCKAILSSIGIDKLEQPKNNDSDDHLIIWRNLEPPCLIIQTDSLTASSLQRRPPGMKYVDFQCAILALQHCLPVHMSRPSQIGENTHCVRIRTNPLALLPAVNVDSACLLVMDRHQLNNSISPARQPRALILIFPRPHRVQDRATLSGGPHTKLVGSLVFHKS